MKRTNFRTILLLAALLAANAGPASASSSNKNTDTGSSTVNSVRFAVISDPHLYNTRLGTSGLEWELTLYRDPKLLAQSEPILDAALPLIAQEGVKFLIISGDLTKDGELVDHVLMAQHLARLEQQGIQVFVVPGNHDIYNPYAVTYLGDTTRPVPNVSPNTFRALYQRFGFGQALSRDATSLSYVAEPVPGLWLLAIDSCNYADNEVLGTPVVGGKISTDTMAWIVAQLEQARIQGKQVIAFMHHGVNLHFFGEDIMFPDYLVDDWPNISAQLANAGLRVIFTGHYHSQDAAFPVDSTGHPIFTLCDVETASLAQYPCAYRIATLENGWLNIESRRLTDVAVDTGGLPFQDFAEQNLRALIQVQIDQVLTEQFGLGPAQIAVVAPLVTDALVANYAGDEAPSAQTQAAINFLLSQGPPMNVLGQLLLGLWSDLYPVDNNLHIPLAPVVSARREPTPQRPAQPFRSHASRPVAAVNSAAEEQ